jgi:hypothetical protein
MFASFWELYLFYSTRGSALQISANHVFKKKKSKKKSKKNFKKFQKKNIDIFFLKLKKTGLPKLLRMS